MGQNIRKGGREGKGWGTGGGGEVLMEVDGRCVSMRHGGSGEGGGGRRKREGAVYSLTLTKPLRQVSSSLLSL